MSKVSKVIISILMMVLCGAVYYFALPAINLRSPGFWAFALLCLACLSVLVWLITYDSDTKHTRTAIKISWGATAIVLALFVIFSIGSTLLFNSDKAYQAADVAISENGFEADFIDLSQDDKNLPLVDLDTARMLGDKKVAQLKHASWYDVDDEYNLIQYQGGYYRLSLIDYGEFFKYTKAKSEGLPGYVLVEATCRDGAVTQDAYVVELETPIRYSPGAYFSNDLRRHLRGQYPSYMFDESYLEIDEEGNPYWVTGVKRPTAFVFGVAKETSFILTNAQTGESQEYAIDDAPEWIDHVYSLDYLMTLAHWHYAYADGFWNNVFSKTNVWRTSYDFRDQHKNDEDSAAGQFANFFGYSSIVGHDGQILFYTGLTAANNAESNLGWLTIDTSSGKMTQYDIVGAEESSAQAAVEQLVQAQRYEATFPLPVNIAGQPSYIMCLKGKAGLVQGYAICNMENYAIAVQAETVDEAIRQYLRKLGSEAPLVTDENSNVETETISGKVIEIYTAEVDGTTQFYYVIGNELYRSPITLNERQVLWKVGDELTVTFYEDGIVRAVVDIQKKLRY